MDLIPIDPEDAQLIFDAFGTFPFSFVAINNPGDYEKENIVFKANVKINSLNNYILVYSVEDTETGISDYSQCRHLTFDDIEMKKGSLLQIYTRKGEDSTSIDFETSALNQTLYWGLPKAIWSTPSSSYELIRRTDSIGGGLTNY